MTEAKTLAQVYKPAIPTLEKVLDLDDAFPAVDPPIQVLGARVLLQLRRVKEMSAGGIALVYEAQETEKANMAVAKVLQIGPLAFKRRDDMQPWPEGVWAAVGDFVRVPRWGGDRLDVAVPGSKDAVTLVVLNDHELIAKVIGDPLSMRGYV